MISYTFNLIPWWAWGVAIAAALIVTYQFWAPIWAMTPRPIKVAIAAIGAILGAYVAGRNRGSKDEREQRAKKDASAIQTRKEIDDEIRSLNPDDTDKRLDRWYRD